MKTLIDHLAQYASYHRDRRNVITHLIGIPTIVVSLTTALDVASLNTWWPQLATSPLSGMLTGATLVSLLATLFYLRLDLRYGMVMGTLLALGCVLGRTLSSLPGWPWWQVSAGLFVVGWIFQFVGHYFEGRKPAFVDDLVGLVVGPLFVVAEAGFFMGLRSSVNAQVVGRAGPLR